MELSTSDIRQFKHLYRTKFGIELDNKTARYKLLKLVRQMYVIHKPITNEQLQAYKAKDVNEDISDETVKPE